MMMFWKIRRRPSTALRVLRSALLLGAAVCVPVGFGVIRRLTKRGALSAQDGQHVPMRIGSSRKRGAPRRSRRKRSLVATRS